MSDFKKLLVWRKARALALNVHRVIVRMRGSNAGSLRRRLLNSAMSIGANLAEGSGQLTKVEFSRFVRFSLDATAELEYHLIVARDTAAISRADFESLLSQTIEIRKMLHGLIRYLTGHSPTPRSKSPRVLN